MAESVEQLSVKDRLFAQWRRPDRAHTFSGWKITGALCAIYFLSIGVTYYGYAAILPSMILDLGWTRGDASLGFALLSIVIGIAGPLAAYSIRRIGARNTIIAGGAVNALGALITYFTDSLLQYYVGVGVVMAVGITFQTLVPAGQVLANWFMQRRALTMGMFLSMGGFGAFISTPAFAYLATATGDWRGAWLVMACSALLASLIAYLFVHNHPDDLGQHQDGVDPSLPPAPAGKTRRMPAVYQTAYQWTMREAVRTRAFWTIITAASIATMGLSLSTSQALIYLHQDRGIDAVLAASALGTVGLMGAVGRLSGGVLGDHFEPRYIMAAGLTLLLVGMVLLNYTDSVVLVYAYAISLGFGYGLSYVSLPTLVANYFSAHDYARLIATSYFVVVPISAIAPIAAGYTYDQVHSYTIIFLGFSALTVVPIVMMMMLRPPVR